MKLLVQEVVTELKQLMTVGDEHIDVTNIRPHIYKHLAPAGSLSIEIRDTNNRVIATSNSVTITDISGSNYFHGYVKFDINAHLKSGESYYIALKSSGYTFSEAAWVGWCTDYDLRKYDADYSQATGFCSAMDLEIWEKRDRIRGY